MRDAWPDVERDVLDALYQKNLNDLCDAYVKARNELMDLRFKQRQIMRFFRHDHEQKAWTARIDDSEAALLNLSDFFQ